MKQKFHSLHENQKKKYISLYIYTKNMYFVYQLKQI